MRTRAQVTVEFLMLMGFLFVIVVGFIVIAASQMEHFSQSKRQRILQDFGDSLQRELALAAVVKEGYVRVIGIPDDIQGRAYTLTMTNLTLTVEMEGNTHVVSIPQTSGFLKPGNNTIRKVNTTIVIENG